jgi:NAD(P)-dependent dehydrogenase (short-subunit alcohol dehydrogenase family)
MVSDRRVALVSGGSRGIGRAICLALADMGIDIAISYRKDSEAAEKTMRDVISRGSEAMVIPGGVEDPDHVERLVDQVVQRFGGIDILVHAAGNASRGNHVADTDPDELPRLMNVHAFAAHHLARSVLPSMRSRGGGDIVLITSIISNGPRPGAAPYVMAKAALDALGYTLAMEERANGIRVNLIAPGLVATDMGDRLIRATQGHESASDLDAIAPFGRVCRPEDVAACAAFLVSDGGGYITGQRIAVDGGESWGWWGPDPAKHSQSSDPASPTDVEIP